MAPPGGAGALGASGQGRGGRSEWKEIGLACAGALSAGAGALAVYYRMNLSKPRDGDRPGVGSWTRRSLQSSDVKPGLDGFTQHFEHQRSPGAGAGFDAYKKAMDTPSFVDTFYDLVTDFYEYGWSAVHALPLLAHHPVRLLRPELEPPLCLPSGASRSTSHLVSAASPSTSRWSTTSAALARRLA